MPAERPLEIVTVVRTDGTQQKAALMGRMVLFAADLDRRLAVGESAAQRLRQARAALEG
jgi:hypothetical protein